MSAADKSIDGRLMECARKEFLAKGFEKASLRNICKCADVTTGALYKRFNGKEELFSSIVEDTSDFIFDCMKYKDELSKKPQSDEFLVKCWRLRNEDMLDWFKAIMDHKEPFTMLIRCSSGTKYQEFEHELALNMSESNYRFYLQAYERGIAKTKISKKDLHILDSAYWKAICEPFIHDYTWEEIVDLSANICSFMDYYRLLGIEKGLIEKYGQTEERIFNFYSPEEHI
jgi:AcrR family transcriptional regulator